MPYNRRHTDSDKCQKCGKKDCNMQACSEEYRLFYARHQEIDYELKLIFNSIRELLNSCKKF